MICAPLHKRTFSSPLIVGTITGGGLDCMTGGHSLLQLYNKVSHWVDYITMEAEKHNEEICVSKLKL